MPLPFGEAGGLMNQRNYVASSRTRNSNQERHEADEKLQSNQQNTHAPGRKLEISRPGYGPGITHLKTKNTLFTQ